MPERKDPDDHRSRLEEYQGALDELLEMPPIEGAEYIAQMWIDIGIYTIGMNGPQPLAWVDIDAYSRCSGVQMMPFECKAVVAMSKAYCSFYRKSKDPGVVTPYLPSGREGFIEIKRRLLDRQADRFDIVNRHRTKRA